MRTTLFVLAALLGACNTLMIDEELDMTPDADFEQSLMLAELDESCTPQAAADIEANTFPWNAT